MWMYRHMHVLPFVIRVVHRAFARQVISIWSFYNYQSYSGECFSWVNLQMEIPFTTSPVYHMDLLLKHSFIYCGPEQPFEIH